MEISSIFYHVRVSSPHCKFHVAIGEPWWYGCSYPTALSSSIYHPLVLLPLALCLAQRFLEVPWGHACIALRQWDALDRGVSLLFDIGDCLCEDGHSRRNHGGEHASEGRLERVDFVPDFFIHHGARDGVLHGNNEAMARNQWGSTGETKVAMFAERNQQMPRVEAGIEAVEASVLVAWDGGSGGMIGLRASGASRTPRGGGGGGEIIKVSIISKQMLVHHHGFGELLVIFLDGLGFFLQYHGGDGRIVIIGMGVWGM